MPTIKLLNPAEPLLDLPQVQVLFAGASKSTVYQWIRTGELVSIKIGKRHLFSLPDLEAFALKRRRKPLEELEAELKLKRQELDDITRSTPREWPKFSSNVLNAKRKAGRS